MLGTSSYLLALIINFRTLDRHRAAFASRMLLLLHGFMWLDAIITPANRSFCLPRNIRSFVIGAPATLGVIKNNHMHDLKGFLFALGVSFHEFSFFTIQANGPCFALV